MPESDARSVGIQLTELEPWLEAKKQKQQLQYTWQVLFLVCFTEKLKNNKCWNGKDKPITAIYNIGKDFLISISTISGSLQLRDLFNFKFFCIANFALL